MFGIVVIGPLPTRCLVLQSWGPTYFVEAAPVRGRAFEHILWGFRLFGFGGGLITFLGLEALHDAV